VVIIRPLCMIRCSVCNREYRQFIPEIGMPQVWPDSALSVMDRVENITTSVPFEMNIEIASA
jgi:hypothetical protein